MPPFPSMRAGGLCRRNVLAAEWTGPLRVVRRPSPPGPQQITDHSGGNRVIVIATNHDGAVVPQPVDHLAWVGAILDAIAQAQHMIHLTRILLDRMQRLRIRVDVRHNQYAHGRHFTPIRTR
jgi:hypothetical protein